MDPAFKHLHPLRGPNLVKKTENSITEVLLEETTEAVLSTFTFQAVLSAELSQVISRKHPKDGHLAGYLTALLGRWVGKLDPPHAEIMIIVS